MIPIPVFFIVVGVIMAMFVLAFVCILHDVQAAVGRMESQKRPRLSPSPNATVRRTIPPGPPDYFS